MQKKANRIRLRVGVRPVRVIPKKYASKHDFPKKEWLHYVHSDMGVGSVP